MVLFVLPVLCCTLCACKERPTGGTQQPVQQGKAALFPPDADVVLLLGEYDKLDAARTGLEKVLRLPQDLPLPYPRVEHHGDRFRVVAGRGKYGALQSLHAALSGVDPSVQVVRASETGGDDVIRLGIVCTQGDPVPLFAPELPQRGKPGEIGRVNHGQVLVLKEEEDSGPEGGSEEAERGFLRVLSPRAGLVRSPDVLLPPDCIPRDEDNDDGNGRLLQGGRLCLTTRFAGRDGEVNRAALLAVTPSYRRCLRFDDAGTFDGFDLNQAGTQFAVEQKKSEGPTAAGASGGTLDLFDVSPSGQLTRRASLPGLVRPAYLGDMLLATHEDQTGQGLVVIDRSTLQGPMEQAPVPRRIFTLPGPRFVAAAPTYRPAAPTLKTAESGGKQGPTEVVVSFQQGCQKADEKRVRAVARTEFEQCLMEVEVEVGLDGKNPKRHCTLNNAPNALEEPINVPCR